MSDRLCENCRKPLVQHEGEETPSQRAKRLWRDPEFRARMAESQRRARSSPEYRDLARKRANEYWSDPANRAAQSERKQRQYADPVELDKQRQRMAIAHVARCGVFVCPPDLRGKYDLLRRALGIKAARDEIRRVIRERAGFDCAEFCEAAE